MQSLFNQDTSENNMSYEELIKNKIKKLDSTINIELLNNGFTVAIYGNDEDENWVTLKLVATSMNDVIQILTICNSMNLNV